MKRLKNCKLGIILILIVTLCVSAAIAIFGLSESKGTGVNSSSAEITAPEKEASSAIAEGELTDDGTISAPEVEAKATATYSGISNWSTAVASTGNTLDLTTCTISTQYTLPSNISLTITIGIGQTVTLTGNGGFNVPSTSSLTITGKQLSGVSGLYMGGSLVNSGSNYTINCNGGSAYLNYVGIRGNASSTLSSVYVTSGGSFTMNGGSIHNNTANYGGGVYVNGGTFNMSSGQIWGNTASLGGGVYLTSSSTFNMNGGLIGGTASGDTEYKNTATSSGGGVCVSSSSAFNMHSGTISYNEAALGGGVWAGAYTCDFTMSGGTISYNKASSNGGGVYWGCGDANCACIISGTISNNEAVNGGGVYVATERIFTLSGGTITGNKASSAGGGVYVSSDKFTRTNSTISSNTATTGVGNDVCFTQSYWSKAIEYSTAYPTTQTGVVLPYNWTASNGSFGTATGFSNGRIHVPSNANIILDLNNCVINRGLSASTSYGSVIYVEGKLVVTDTSSNGNGQIKGGYTSDGGGVYVYGSSANFTLSGGTITGNTATGGQGTYGGGGVCVSGGTFTMTGGTISGNTASGTFASYGGGVLMTSGATFTMTGGEISGNTGATSWGGGGVYVGSGTFKMSGSPVISGNHLKNDSDNDVHLVSSTITINGALTPDAHVGLVKQGKITSGYSTYNASDAPSNFFFSNGGVEVLLYEGEAWATSSINMIAWTSAVSASLNDRTQKTVTLTEDWTAVADSSDGTSFGNGTGFLSGQIYVPSGANIVLDLNGHTIDRNLTAALAYGRVIYNYGTIEIKNTSSSKNGKITGGNCTGDGGGVYVNSGSAFILSGGEISGNTAASGGGVYVGSGATFTMTGGEISDNTATSNGSGVHVGSDATFTMNGGGISGNTAYSGGGVYVNSGTFNMNGGEISGNTPTGDGGGIYCNYGTFTLTDGEISGNTARDGGGICTYGGAVVYILGGRICENTATGTNGGGGIYTVNTGGGTAVITVSGGEISGNTATNGNGGGMLSTSRDEFNMNGGTISGNTATNGGGVYVNYYCTFTMGAGEIFGNTATTNGGGVYVSGGTFNMNGGEIFDNTAVKGGGVCGSNASSTFSISGGVIFGNLDANGARNNVYTSSTITVTGKLSTNTQIGISADSAKTLTSGYSSSGNKIGNVVRYFISDNDDYIISNNGTEVTVVAVTDEVKTVDWKYTSYSASFDELEEVEGATGIEATATYTGGAFVFKAITDGIVTATDANGRTVTNFVNVGTYLLNIKPTYAGQYKNPFLNFTILPADINDRADDVKILADPVVYTGKALTTSVKVILDGNLLEEGKDYTLSYENNVNAGEGTVIISAMGNYTGTLEHNFTIQKAKIGVRTGLTRLTYNGDPQGWAVYPEGLKNNDTVTLTVKYAPVVNNVVGTYSEDLPVKVGQYAAMVVLDDENYELIMSYEEYFYIVEKTVDAIWSTTEFVYTGEAHEITAYFVDAKGNRVDLTVTLDEGSLTNAGKGKVSTALPDGYENYILTDSTSSVSFSIAKAEIQAVWPDEYNFKYDGTAQEVAVTLTGIKGEPLNVTYVYYDADGNEITDNGGKPVAAGEYKVVISFTDDNYTLIGKTEDTFTVAQAGIVISLIDEELTYVYDGTGKAPAVSVKDELGDDIDESEYTVTYAAVNAAGAVIGAYSSSVPVNAGSYVLKVEFSAGGIDHSEWISEVFVIEQKSITADDVDWDFGKDAFEIDGVYTYLYNGKSHQPTATADGIKLTLSGSWTNVGRGYITVASLNNANYKLVEEIQVTFNIIQSKVSSVIWYEYGSEDPIDGYTPKYEYTSVYGQEGPRLSAYGVLVPYDDSIDWDAEADSIIALNVSYDRYSSGYWTELGTYTALANLSSADKLNNSCYMPLGINDELSFEVTAVTHAADTANILWVVEVDGRHEVVDGNYNFTYNGDEQAPMAILITSNSYKSEYPEEGTYVVLSVGGAQTDAGTYYAYILTDDPNVAHLEINEGDEECMFTILPKDILIKWEDDNGDGEVVVPYSGEEQAPWAYVVDKDGNPVYDEDGDLIYLDVEGFTEAGVYYAIAQADENHKIINGTSVKFVIKQLEINPEDIVWNFAEGDEGNRLTDSDGSTYFMWEYDGKEHAPTATLEVVLVEDEDPVVIKLTLTGSATNVGIYYVYATLDNSEPENANYVMPVVRFKLKIVQDTIEALWDEDGYTVVDGVLVYTYDGEVHKPTAYYLDKEGNRVNLHVIGSGKDAGNYIAFITDDLDIANGKTQAFRIEAKEVKADWDKTNEYDYNGYVRYPTVTFYETVTGEDGEEERVTVSLRLGVDYTVSGFTNAGTYTSEITLLGNNYKFADDSDTHEFVISKRVVRLDWFGKDGSDDFVWAYDGEKHAPTAKTNIEGLKIVIMGAEKEVGKYIAVAVLDDDNYTFADGADKQEFTIVGSEVSIIWEGENGSDNDFEWEYDGKYHTPKAFIVFANGDRTELDVVVDGGIYAGEYTAYAILPSNCKLPDGETNEHSFTIGKRIIEGIIWKGVDGSEDDFDWEYDGSYHVPTAEMAGGGILDVTGAAINKGAYKAIAILSDEANYAFAEGVNEYEHEFTIHARTTDVVVEWKGENGEETDFHWEYDGKVHCPTAWFYDVFNNLVQIPVIGGTASGGEHTATLVDIFDNYDFFEGKTFCTFYIDQMPVNVTWDSDDDGYAEDEDNGSITYTYEYNGKAQRPTVTAKDEDGTPIDLNYLIINKADGSKVSAIINAGTYEVTVTPVDKNYKLADGEVKTVTVVIERKGVQVDWDETPLVYNGKNQMPKAYYTDLAGNNIELTVTVDGNSADTDVTYTATAVLVSENYVLTGDKITHQFVIVKSTATEYKWVWDEDGNGSWVEVKDETDPGSGEGEDKTEPETPDPNPDGNEGGTGEGNGNETGNETGNGDGDGDGDGTPPTDPDTSGNGDGNDGNEAIVPGNGGSGTGEEGEDGDENGDGDGDGNETDPETPDADNE